MRATFFSILAFLSLTAAASIDPKCIRTRVLEGTTCQSLKVDFDFGLCGVGALVGKTVQSTCVNQKAVAFVRGEKEVYIVTYGSPQEEGGKWKFLSVRKQSRRFVNQSAAVHKEATTTVVVSPDLMKKAEDLAAKTEENLKNAETQTAQSQSSEASPLAKPVPSTSTTEAEKTVETMPSSILPVNLQQLAKIKFNGHVDTYYSYNVNSPTPNAAPTTNSLQLNPTKTNKYRAFDGYHDQFTLAMALFSIQKEEDGNGFVVDLGFGQNTAAMLNYSEATQYVPQAYLKLKMNDSWNFYAGKMFTHMGMESAYAVKNWNYSRSLLYSYAVPVSHTGVAFENKTSVNFTSTFYIYNNWSGMFEYNRTKNFGLRFDYTPNESLNVKYNLIGGNEKSLVPDSARVVHDLNATWQLSSKVHMQFEYLMGSENKALATGGDAAWNSAIIGMIWKFAKETLDLRAELYSDADGYTIDGGYNTSLNKQNITAMTVGYSWHLSPGAQTHLEFRQDQSDSNVFRDVNGGATNAQMTGLMAFTYEF